MGVSHISNQISGRLTLAMLHKMRAARQNDSFADQEDNEFDQVKKLLESKERLQDRIEVLNLKTREENLDKLADIEIRKQLKAIQNEMTSIEIDLLQKLKVSFKHITGMWPKTANFDTEAQRLESWQTTVVIKNKVFNPSKRLVICQ